MRARRLALLLIILNRVLTRLTSWLRGLRLRRLFITAAILLPLAALIYFGVTTFWLRPSTGLDSSVEMVVDGLEPNRTTGQILVVLKEKTASRKLSMVVGEPEARTIFVELRGVRPDAPMTHDVMRDMLERLGARVDHVVVNSVSGGTFTAKIHLSTDGRRFEVDSRPSDAIALALRTHAPIFVDATVLARAGTG